jgi:hypothetical protein
MSIGLPCIHLAMVRRHASSLGLGAALLLTGSVLIWLANTPEPKQGSPSVASNTGVPRGTVTSPEPPTSPVALPATVKTLPERDSAQPDGTPQSTLSGWVRDVIAGSIAGANITATSAGLGTNQAATTRDGRFQLNLAEGSWRLTAVK